MGSDLGDTAMSWWGPSRSQGGGALELCGHGAEQGRALREGKSGTPLPATSPCQPGTPQLFVREPLPAGRSLWAARLCKEAVLAPHGDKLGAGWVWGDWVFKAGG